MRHDNGPLCIGSWVNTNYERIPSWGGCPSQDIMQYRIHFLLNNIEYIILHYLISTYFWTWKKCHLSYIMCHSQLSLKFANRCIDVLVRRWNKQWAFDDVGWWYIFKCSSVCLDDIHPLPMVPCYLLQFISQLRLLMILTITSIPTQMKKHMPSKMWNKITYPFPNFNNTTLGID